MSEQKRTFDKVFEEMGIVFGEHVGDDPRLAHCRLPRGWKEMLTGRPADCINLKWTGIVDETGRTRVASWGDHIAALQRLRITADYNEEFAFAEFRDGNNVLFRIERRPSDREACALLHEAGAEAEAWADLHFPEWRSVRAYWGEDLTTLMIRP